MKLSAVPDTHRFVGSGNVRRAIIFVVDVSTVITIRSIIPAMTDPDLMRRAGAKLKGIRLRLGLSIREVARRSLKLGAERLNPDYSLSKASIGDIENGRFVPGTFKIVTLCEIYKLTISEVHAFYGIEPGDITKERPLFALPKTHLIIPTEERSESACSPVWWIFGETCRQPDCGISTYDGACMAILARKTKP
jgi:transcriptional regulator with XRE-family HTH domain